MRLRSVLAVGAAALLVLSGCAPTPTPKPKPSASPTASATPTPTPEPIVEPEAAFDVTCDDVAAVMAGLVGEPSTPVQPVMSTVSAMSWLPGPGQYMFQRSGGIACSAGDDAAHWDVAVVPGARAVTDGAASRDGFWGEHAECIGDGCDFRIVEGDVLLTAEIRDADMAATGDTETSGAALRALAASAASSLHNIELIDSEIVGAACERFLTTQELAEAVGDVVVIVDTFGGWGIPAEVYHVVNGSRICLYKDDGSEYEGTSYLMITTLPGGAWAFERAPGDAVEIEGADAAKVSAGPFNAVIVDLRAGTDWIRLTVYEGGARVADPLSIAAKVVRNITIGHTAPQ